MGAHNFVERSNIEDPRKAYEQLVDAAEHEHGHDSYNGTISTTRGLTVVSRRPVSAAEAEMISNRRLHQLSKWGPCEAIAVGKPTRTVTRTATITIDLDGAPGRVVHVQTDAVAAALGVGPGDVESFTVTKSVVRYKTTVRKAGPVRRFWTTSAGGEFATRAEAVAHARRRLDTSLPASWSGAGADRVATGVQVTEAVTVHQRVVHEPEAAVIRTAVSWKVTVDAVVAACDDRVFDHWLFYGWAAS